MNGRERIKLALAHREADRVPVDFGGCAQTTIQAGVVAKLREHFGLERRPVIVEEPYTMMGRLDEDLKQAMGVDVDALNPLYSFFGLRRAGWKEFRMEDRLEVLVPGEFNYLLNPGNPQFTLDWVVAGPLAFPFDGRLTKA